jgi:hypothetical protein
LPPESNHQTAGQKPLSAHISHKVTQVSVLLGPQILLYFLFYFMFYFYFLYEPCPANPSHSSSISKKKKGHTHLDWL